MVWQIKSVLNITTNSNNNDSIFSFNHMQVSIQTIQRNESEMSYENIKWWTYELSVNELQKIKSFK
jgi:hypothetical protein